jgi:hypothetical protein
LLDHAAIAQGSFWDFATLPQCRESGH